MNIQEARKMRINLECEIVKLLASFHDETTIPITGLDVNRVLLKSENNLTAATFYTVKAITEF